MRAAIFAWAVVLGIGGCGEDAGKKPDPKAEAQAACEESIAKAASAAPTERAALLAKGCEACPGLATFVQKPPARADEATKLFAGCALPGKAALWFPLPVASALPGAYALPSAAYAEPLSEAAFVIVGDKDLRVGTVPFVSLANGKLTATGEAPGEASPLEAAEKLAAAIDTAADKAASREAGGVVFLADADGSASRLLTVASQSGTQHGRLGVAGKQAMAHKIELEVPSIETAAPVIHIDDRGFSVDGSGGEPIPRDEAARLQTTLKNLVAERAPLTRIVIEASGKATVADLAVAFDAASAANIHTVLLPAAPE